MKDKYNIVYVSHFNHMRMGGQRSMTHLIEHLDRSRFQPMAICPSPGELSEKLATLDCPSFFVPLYSLKPKFLHHAPPALLKIRSILKKNNAHIVHPDFTADTFLCGLAKSTLKTKMVWHVRWNEHFSKDVLHEKLADAIISVSQAAASRFSPAVQQSKFHCIYNGVDCELFKPVDDKSWKKEALGLDSNRQTFIFVGVLKEGKGVVDIVSAFAMLKKSIGSKQMPRLLMIGSKGKQETYDSIQQIISSNDLSEDIQILPQQTNIHEWMQCADLLLIPSHEGNEGMPRVMYEAMACGTPVIGSNTSGINEGLSAETGFLVEQKSPTEISEVLLQCVDNPEKLRSMSEACRLRALDLFDIVKHARRVEEVYLKLLS